MGLILKLSQQDNEIYPLEVPFSQTVARIVIFISNYYFNSSKIMFLF